MAEITYHGGNYASTRACKVSTVTYSGNLNGILDTTYSSLSNESKGIELVSDRSVPSSTIILDVSMSISIEPAEEVNTFHIPPGIEYIQVNNTLDLYPVDLDTLLGSGDYGDIPSSKHEIVKRLRQNSTDVFNNSLFSESSITAYLSIGYSNADVYDYISLHLWEISITVTYYTVSDTDSSSKVISNDLYIGDDPEDYGTTYDHSLYESASPSTGRITDISITALLRNKTYNKEGSLSVSNPGVYGYELKFPKQEISTLSDVMIVSVKASEIPDYRIIDFGDHQDGVIDIDVKITPGDSTYVVLLGLIIVVTYGDPRVKYRTDTSWVGCEVFYGSKDTWVKCLPHYGVDNSWVESSGK